LLQPDYKMRPAKKYLGQLHFAFNVSRNVPNILGCPFHPDAIYWFECLLDFIMQPTMSIRTVACSPAIAAAHTANWRVLTKCYLSLLLCTMASTAPPSFAEAKQDRGTATVNAIRRAATKLEDARLQPYPLPLAASWNTGVQGVGFDPEFQLQRIARGDYLLPWFGLTRPDELFVNFRFEAAFRKAAELGLPISFVSTQWDVLVAEELRDRQASAAGSYDRANLTREQTQPLSPFSPAEAWYDAGRRWGRHPALLRLQALYPNPPLVLFVSNNEQPKLSWRQIRGSSERRDRLALDASDDSIRLAVGNGWIERYKNLQRGFRDALVAPGWKHAAIFVGYDAFASNAVGRWPDWIAYSLITPGRLEPWPLAWEGVSPSYYVPDWNVTSDFQVMSPQIEAMNWLPFLEEAYRLNPSLWFELSVWDGQQQTAPTDKATYYRTLGQVYDPQRYAGFIQFGMWLLRPRLVREFRDHLATRARFESYFDSVTNAVRRVHEQPDLRRFWEGGRLVANTRVQHPYTTALPENLARAQRWYLLDSDLNPKRPWSLDTPIRVYSLALEIGKAPQREWLIYAFAPLDADIKTTVRISDGPAVTAHASRNGCFSLLHEQSSSAIVVTC
jgi:hypothetical protein